MLRLLFALLLLASPALAQRLVTQTATPGAGQLVVLDLRYAHAIRVQPGSGPELSVRATVTISNKTLDQSYYLAVEAGKDNELLVREYLEPALLKRDWGHDERDDQPAGRRRLLLDYEVTLPAGQPLRIKTITGNITAENLTGAVTASTISGDLALANLRGAVKAHTVSGDIRLRELAGTAPVDALTVSGDVDASWPPARGAELSLKSISGEVYADSTVTFSNLRQRSYVGYELRGRVAGGSGPLVSLHTVSGDVFFRRK